MIMVKRVVQLYLKNHLFILISILFLVVYYFSAHRLHASATVFPRYIINYVFIPVLLWNLIGSFFEIKDKLQNQVKKVELIGQKESDFGETKKIVSLIFLFVYIFFIIRLGFIISTSLFLVAFSYFMGIRNFIKIVLFVLIIDTFIYFIFFKWLMIELPSGILF